MIHVDQYGLEFTTESNDAADAYVEGLDLLLRNRIEAEPRLLQALELDPGFALGWATLAALQHVNDGGTIAVAQILLAAQHAKHTTRREQQLIAAFRRAIVGDVSTASAMTETHLEDYPGDVLVVRERLLLQNFGGDAQRKHAIVAQLAALAARFGNDPWFLGNYSFALSEVGNATDGRQMAETALAAHPDHSVLAHSLAHTLFESADDAAALDYLDGWLSDYGDGVALAGHLTWHLALTQLALSEPECALALFGQQKKVDHALGFAREDAISLLWRLHLRGIDVSDEWGDLLARTTSRGPRRPFELAHLAFALAALGDDDGLRQLAIQVQQDADVRPHQPFGLVVPLIDALRLVVARQWREAVRALEVAAPQVRRLGGSNEQHTIIDETIAYARRTASQPSE